MHRSNPERSASPNINEDERTVESIQNALTGTTIAVAHVTGSGQGGIGFLESDGADVIVFRINRERGYMTG